MPMPPVPPAIKALGQPSPVPWSMSQLDPKTRHTVYGIMAVLVFAALLCAYLVANSPKLGCPDGYHMVADRLFPSVTYICVHDADAG